VRARSQIVENLHPAALLFQLPRTNPYSSLLSGGGLITVLIPREATLLTSLARDLWTMARLDHMARFRLPSVEYTLHILVQNFKKMDRRSRSAPLYS
jgi:hypothetical protein